MPDNPQDPVVVRFNVEMQVSLAQLAAMLLRAEAEKHPAISGLLSPQYEEVLATSAPKPPPEPPQEPVETPVDTPAPETPPHTPPEPSPAAARAGRPPRANGKAPPAKAAEPEKAPEPEPEKPLEESEVRAVLRLFSTIMPGRDTAVVKLLQEVGGAPRLADCDRETWPAIVAAAKQGIAANAQAAD